MREPVEDPAYWKQRILEARNIHQSVFLCSPEKWQRIEAKHQEILARHIRPNSILLDAGCGYGRLVDLLPEGWYGAYYGVDLSADMIKLAKERHLHTRGHLHFKVGDLSNLSDYSGNLFDWAIISSIRPMVRRYQGHVVWSKMETELRRVARNLLYLEYDETDEGSVAQCTA